MKKIISLVFISVVIAIFLFARPYRIAGDCMEPAIADGKLYFVNKIYPYLRQYKIGDIIAFKYEDKEWLSRVVALENNTIQISDGKIIVDGAILQEKPVDRNWTDWRYGTYGIDKPFQVPSGCVYVLSDNLSAHHDDSRVFGPIPHEFIVGVFW